MMLSKQESKIAILLVDLYLKNKQKIFASRCESDGVNEFDQLSREKTTASAALNRP